MKTFYYNIFIIIHQKDKKRLTWASGDNKLLQTQVYVQVILEDWKLEREKRNKDDAASDKSKNISW